MTHVPLTHRATTPGMPAAGFGVVQPVCGGVSDGDVSLGVVGSAGVLAGAGALVAESGTPLAEG
jgi:hypothetical protein